MNFNKILLDSIPRTGLPWAHRQTGHKRREKEGKKEGKKEGREKGRREGGREEGNVCFSVTHEHILTLIRENIKEKQRHVGMWTLWVFFMNPISSGRTTPQGTNDPEHFFEYIEDDITQVIKELTK